jgi:hypothetical protein
VLVFENMIDVINIKTHLIERPDTKSHDHAFKFIECEVSDLLLILRAQYKGETDAF